LQFLDNPEVEEHGERENFYQLETEAFWDDGKGKSKTLKVLVAIDDGGLTAFCPYTEDFIITPDGKILGARFIPTS